MPSNDIPALDTNGWLTNPAEKADYAFSMYLTSEASQSNSADGKVRSLANTVAKNNSNPKQMVTDVTNDLNFLFNAWFDTVSVDVSITTPNPDDVAQQTSQWHPVAQSAQRYNLQITMTLTQGGQTYSFGQLVATAGNRIMRVTPLNRI